MRNKELKIFFSVLILLLALGVIFFFWRGEKFDFSNQGAGPAPGLSTSPTPLATLPESDNLPPDQKPAEDKIIKFPIFNYHHLGALPPNADINRRAFTVSPAMLEEHIKYLIDNGYQIVPASDLINYYDTGASLPQKAVALTFDDGYREHFTNAFPILKKYGVTATFFIVTGWASSSTRPDYLTWPQIQAMAQAGLRFGSHAVSHPNLTKLSDEGLQKELVESKKILEEKTGQPCDLLAYPGGSYDGRVIEAVKAAGYRGALSVYKIIEQAPKYRFSIRRFHADDNLESITEKLTDY